MRKNLLGTENLNEVIQTALNPSGPSLVRGCTHYRRNDRVMQLRNNYDKEVFNGDIGFIKEVDEEDRALVVLAASQLGRARLIDNLEIDA